MKIPWPHWFLSQKEQAVNTLIKYCLSLSLIFKTNCQIEECHFTQCPYITKLSTSKKLPNWGMSFCTVQCPCIAKRSFSNNNDDSFRNISNARVTWGALANLLALFTEDIFPPLSFIFLRKCIFVVETSQAWRDNTNYREE